MDTEESQNSVAVIIPPFSRVESTIRAVNSVLSQTVKPKYIYVIDDGSPDHIYEELRKGIDESLVTIVKSNRSSHPGITRNVGVELTSTDWIAFLDSDDYWIETKLERQLKFAQEKKARATCTNAFKNENRLQESFYNKIPKVISTRKLLKNNYIINSSVLIERSLLLSIGGVVSDYAVRGVEDYATWLRVSKLEDWYVLDENLVHYEQDSSDSIRKSTQVNHYSQVFAWIDFASWSRRSTGSKQTSLRILLKLLGKFIGGNS
jgi:glycosyltransferase involved in cell wall biosynthesis